MKYSDEVQEELNKLVNFGGAIGMILVLTNGGHSVAVYRRGYANTGASRYSLEKLVSLYNKGIESPYYRPLRKWQKHLVERRHGRPGGLGKLTLQRYRGGLKVGY